MATALKVVPAEETAHMDTEWLCRCGCGQRVQPSQYNRRGMVKDGPQRFVRGHMPTGNRKPNEAMRSLYRSTTNGKREHVVIAERALGKDLPKGAEVHHVDGNGLNNDPSNLVVCQDSAYHKLLHQRARALAATGHAGYLKCRVCKAYDAPETMVINQRVTGPQAGQDIIVHRTCRARVNSDRNPRRCELRRLRKAGAL